MNKKELDKILSQHSLWLISGGKEGERADLRGACLTGANLTDVELCDCVGNRKEIKSLQIEYFSITYTSEIIQIGCEQHSFEEWKSFDDGEIDSIDDQALKFWRKWKDWIFKTVEMSPAISTGHTENKIKKEKL